MKLKAETKPILSSEELSKLGRAEEIDVLKENELVREIVANLKRTMRKNNILTLSAPAIGYNKRIFCVDFCDNEIKTYINPIISFADGLMLTREVCTSIPGKEFIIPRNTTIDIYYQTPKGMNKHDRFSKEVACVFQHELQHLDGLTLDILGLEIEEDFDKATEEERAEIIDMYLDSLDMRRKDLDEVINSDEELSKVYGAMKFREAVMRGEVELESSEE